MRLPPGVEMRLAGELDAEALEALMPAIADLGVAEAGGGFTAQAFQDILGGEAGQGRVNFLRVANVVTRSDDARMLRSGFSPRVGSCSQASMAAPLMRPSSSA